MVWLLGCISEDFDVWVDEVRQITLSQALAELKLILVVSGRACLLRAKLLSALITREVRTVSETGQPRVVE